MHRIALTIAAVLGGACVADVRDAVPENLPEIPEPPFPSTEAGIDLGRRLFFDVRLSGDDTLACASCHQPERAFSDGVARSSVGASGATLARNAPGLANIAWPDALFWDGGSKNLESLVLAPITNPDEMNQSLVTLVDELMADPEYVRAFAEAFPEDGLVVANVMRALAQYMRTLISGDSRYDRFVRGEGGNLSHEERAGLEVYEMHCATCHATDLFTDNGFHNNGLDATFPTDAEALGRGRARITLAEGDIGKFRTPSLRNLGFTAPYMHDGRLETLEDVIAHYRFGIVESPTLDRALVTSDSTTGITLSDDEARALLAFLRTLDDPRFVERHADDGAR